MGGRQALFRLLACAVLLALTMCRAQARTGALSVTLNLDGGADTLMPSRTDSATVTFPSKTIDTLVAVVPSNNNSGGGTLCGARDYRFQITTDGTNWTTVSTVTGNTTEWVLHATIPLQAIKGMRLIIDNINNGRWYNDYTA